MDGAPIFQASTRLVGIHLATGFDVERRTGFNIAVPADAIISLLAQTDMTDSD